LKVKLLISKKLLSKNIIKFLRIIPVFRNKNWIYKDKLREKDKIEDIPSAF
jgi:hypothetical protein